MISSHGFGGPWNRHNLYHLLQTIESFCSKPSATCRRAYVFLVKLMSLVSVRFFLKRFERWTGNIALLLSFLMCFLSEVLKHKRLETTILQYPFFQSESVDQRNAWILSMLKQKLGHHILGLFKLGISFHLFKFV